MHCMNRDFSLATILPPFNTLHAQVIERRGDEPRIVTLGVSVKYSIPVTRFPRTKRTSGNTLGSFRRDTATQYRFRTGNGLSGEMKPTGNNDWSATGIPITPLNDTWRSIPIRSPESMSSPMGDGWRPRSGRPCVLESAAIYATVVVSRR